MTASDPTGPDETATGLLVLRGTGGPDRPASVRLLERLAALGFETGHLVGTVLPVTGPRERLEALADHVGAARRHEQPPGADLELLDLLARTVDDFAWDEGAELF